VAQLLVSVRSTEEAVAAVDGGAAVVDVKEPLHGSLGRAECSVWRAVRQVVPAHVPVSVALGELNEWLSGTSFSIAPGAFAGLAYCKIGLAHAPGNWIDRWQELRARLAGSERFEPAWVAVVYLDWQAAHAPAPEAVIDAAMAIDTCQGVLFDTWEKARKSAIGLGWKPVIDRAREAGKFIALAGSLDVDAIRHLAPLQPHLFAVRGAACAGGDRLGPIDRERVAALARAVT
jgi:uncharacterized protein (UPF0264 family)